MRRKLLLAVLVLFWLSAGAWFFATPYLTVWKLQRAANAGDANGISEHVDFPALRESLRATVADKIAAAASAAPSTPLTQMGAGLANALAQMTIDALVTPDTVVLMLHGIRPDMSGISAARAGEYDLSMGYSAFSRFVVEAKHSGTTDPPLQLIFTRSGLSTWMLTAVRV